MSKVGEVVGGLFGGGDGDGGSGRIVGLLKNVRKKRQTDDTGEIQETEAARKRAREAEQLRRGRRASILTSGRGVTEPLGSAQRPRASSLLGG